MNTTTEEKNRVLAEFMQWPSDDEKTFYISDSPMPIKLPFGQYEVQASFKPEELHFHTSYDWIMPVVNKCLVICHAEMLNEWEESFTDAFSSMSIERLHNESFKFAVWYKENSHS